MGKIVERIIVTCDECPYHSWVLLRKGGGYHKCWYLKERKIESPKEDVFPSFCPLKDSE